MKDLVTLIDLVQAWIDRTEADACTECKYFGTEEWEMPLPTPYKGGEEE